MLNSMSSSLRIFASHERRILPGVNTFIRRQNSVFRDQGHPTQPVKQFLLTQGGGKKKAHVPPFPSSARTTKAKFAAVYMYLLRAIALPTLKPASG